MLGPVLETVPQTVPLHSTPAMAQFTIWFVLKQTVALSPCGSPSATEAAEGEMEMAGEHGATSVTEAAAERDASATLVAVRVTSGGEGSVVGAV